MRGLPARRIASTTLSAAVLVGITGPAAVAVDSAHERAHAPSRAPVPGAEKLLAQVKALRSTGSVLNPALDLLEQSLTKGKLPSDQAKRLGDAAKKAVAKAASDPTSPAPTAPTAPATPTLPATPSLPATPTLPAAPTTPVTGTVQSLPTKQPSTATEPSAPAKPSVSAAPSAAAEPSVPATPSTSAEPGVPAKPTAPAAPSASAIPAAPVAAAVPLSARIVHIRPPAARDLTDDTLTALDKAIDNLVNSVTSQLDQLIPSAGNLIDGLVDLLTTTLLGTDVPAPSLTPLPSLPSVSAPPNLPAT
ncbi:hypothetical protein AB0M41_06385 [Streptomyces sp. NPDC051896]|uniref:hypothetical protein n=1 Tax=Streptomyces sp. NPDC051896 TaxID=3155416 RepID=UPI00342B4AD3